MVIDARGLGASGKSRTAVPASKSMNVSSQEETAMCESQEQPKYTCAGIQIMARGI